MAHPLPIPCPVQLGTLKGDSLEAELHHSVRDGNCGTVRKILKKGASVDAVNSLGQTPLFTAALLGLGKIVDVLLDYGSDPNHRCYDGSTPVHAAAFSGSQWILSKLLDEGGDLRVHDEGGRNPQCWAMSAGKESSAQMLEFIQRCTFHMQAAIQNFPYDPVRKIYSSKALVSSPSRFSGLVQGPLGRFLKGGVNAAKNIYSFGFGKFYLAGSSHLGYLASLPIIGEKEVVQADDEPTFSYRVGPYMIMTNLMWGSSRVTVKELSFQPHQNCSKLRLADLLIAEQEHSSKLRHPHLLQLMSVCLSSDLEKTRLVYERVNFGSLYSILHERRSEFPVLRMETILHILLQINDALRFLHSRGFIHRTISSYAIQIVSSGEAKLCNMEYMIESKDGGEHSDLTRIPVPAQLYKWCSPEVILEKSVTVKSDIYSFCTVMQEALTETLPWNGIEDSVIKQLVISGQQLEADVRLPVPYYDIVKSGLESKQKNRTMNLQDIQFTLKNDLKDLSKSQSCHADEMAKAQRPAVFADINICLSSTFSYRKRTLELNKGGSAAPRCPAFPEENNTLVDIEAPTSVQLDAQENTDDAASETQMTCSVSDVDDSLCSFEMNEVFASCPDFHEGFLKKGAELNRTQDDKKRQQKEKDENVLGDMFLSPGMYCEEKPVDEEGGVSESVAEYTTEEEERKSEASDLSTLAQVRGDAGRRRSTLPSNEHHISKCVLDLKIVQSMLQQVAESLSRTEKNLDKLEAAEKQKKLLQEVGNSRPFSAANTSLWKAEGPPSRDYIPPLVTCHSQGALCGDSFQSVSNVTEEMWAVQNEKWKCFHQRSESKNENSQHDLSFRELKTEVRQMARKVASGRLELIAPHLASDCTSESEVESIKEAFQHVTSRAQKGQDQHRYRWYRRDSAEPWNVDCEDESESEESDLDSLFRSSEGKTEKKIFSFSHQISASVIFVRTVGHFSSRVIPQKQSQVAQSVVNSVFPYFRSVTDIQDLSSIPCKEENYYGDINCKTPGVSRAPPSVSTPISAGNLLAQAPIHLLDELPAPAQELLDEIGKSHFTQNDTRCASCVLKPRTVLQYTITIFPQIILY
uniref:Inactive serine/threonine-protein kinase TEX14 n=1 Tax=Coturnix japonica TaxID=93934 RepID=A0A8C2U308_COTJA